MRYNSLKGQQYICFMNLGSIVRLLSVFQSLHFLNAKISVHFLNAKISVHFLNAKIRFRFIYQVTFAFSFLKKLNEKEFFYEVKRIIENKDLWSEMTRYLPVAPRTEYERCSG